MPFENHIIKWLSSFEQSYGEAGYQSTSRPGTNWAPASLCALSSIKSWKATRHHTSALSNWSHSDFSTLPSDYVMLNIPRINTEFGQTACIYSASSWSTLQLTLKVNTIIFMDRLKIGFLATLLLNVAVFSNVWLLLSFVSLFRCALNIIINEGLPSMIPSRFK